MVRWSVRLSYDFVKKWPLENQMVNATYLKPTYLHTYLCDSGDSSDMSDISGISDSNDRSDQKTVSQKNFFLTQIFHL